jgi:hypothetical protein
LETYFKSIPTPETLLGVTVELTEEQIKFLDIVCFGVWVFNDKGEVDVEGNISIRKKGLTQIPVKFGRVSGDFSCSWNNLTTLKNCPDYVGEEFFIYSNNLTDYFKSIKEEDFPHWKNLEWLDVLRE